MLNNAYISFITESGGGFDTDGNPIQSSKIESEYIHCNLKVNKRGLVIIVDGQQVQFNYAIYFELDSFNQLDLLLSNIKEVSIKDDIKELKEHQIHSIEYLKITKKIKLLL